MADTRSGDQNAIDPKGAATTPAPEPAPKPAGVMAIPSDRVRVGLAVNPLSKGQRKHLRRQKEAGETKVSPRRSQVSR